jgi:hypothetical protein
LDGYPDELEAENALAVAKKALAKLIPDSYSDAHTDKIDKRKIAGRLSIKLTGQGYSFDLINRTVEKVLRDLE